MNRYQVIIGADIIRVTADRVARDGTYLQFFEVGEQDKLVAEFTGWSGWNYEGEQPTKSSASVGPTADDIAEALRVAIANNGKN